MQEDSLRQEEVHRKFNWDGKKKLDVSKSIGHTRPKKSKNPVFHIIQM